MEKKWIGWVTLAFVILSVFYLGLAFSYRSAVVSDFDLPEVKEVQRELPPRPFLLPKESYREVGGDFFSLDFSPRVLKVPDLRKQIFYHGKNKRPDRDPSRAVVHLSFGTAQNKTVSIETGKRTYLVFDKEATPAKYTLSPGNKETSLWIETTLSDKELIIHVGMVDEKGNPIVEPKSHLQFSLPEKEMLRFVNGAIDLGKYRADGSILVQQKAKWYGQDKFLERHGGEEFAELLGKQRIDFEDEEEPYSVFIGKDSVLAFVSDRWVEMKPSEESRNYPILVLQKVSDRLMSLELYAVDGRGKLPLNLIKSAKRRSFYGIEKEFEFSSARTWSQFIFEVSGQRMLIKPKDWLLKTDDGWIKLETVEQIDDFLNRKLTGTLLVIDKVGRKEGKQVLHATAFDPSRTESEEIEIFVQKGKDKREDKDGKPSLEGVSLRPSLTAEDDDEDDDEER